MSKNIKRSVFILHLILATLSIQSQGLDPHTTFYSAIDSNQLEAAEAIIDSLFNAGHFKEDPITGNEYYVDLASRYLNMHDYEKSIMICSRMIPVMTAINDRHNLIHTLIIMFDNVSFSQKDSSNQYYLKRAYEIAHETGDSSLISDTYFGIGRALYRQGQHMEAVNNYKLARSYVPKRNISKEIDICVYEHLSYTFMDSVFDQACSLSQYVFEQTRINKLEHLWSNAYLMRAYCYAKSGIVDSAGFYIKKADLTRQTDYKKDASPGFYYQMFRVAMLIPDYDLALNYLERSNVQSRNITLKNNADLLAESRSKFDYELQKARIGELKALNEASRILNQRRKVTLFGLGIILALSLVSSVMIRRQYSRLRLSYTSLVKRFIEIDQMRRELLFCEEKNPGRRNEIIIKDEDEIFDNLKLLLDKSKIYQDQDISLASLAEKLNTNTTYLSNIINNRYQQNFKSLINHYRVNEARQLLIDPNYSNYSIEGIASQVGFNSRSSFYQTFKQVTGMTPTAYIAAYERLS